MAKEAYYFSHDLGARNDPKLQKVLMKLGQAGKGVYWDLVEMLFEEGGKLLISEIESYAFALRSDNDCITKLINDFDLFVKDEVFFWSNSVNRRILEREEKSEKARYSANERWRIANALKNDANALREESDSNAIKEKKGKENKPKDNIYSDFSFFNNGFEEVWKTFKEHRVKIKKPLTQNAEKLNLIDLDKLCNSNKEQAIKLVNHAIKKGWQTFYPIKEESGVFGNSDDRLPKIEQEYIPSRRQPIVGK